MHELSVSLSLLFGRSGSQKLVYGIDIIDYVTGIGNMRAIRVAVKSVKIDKNSPRMTHF